MLYYLLPFLTTIFSMNLIFTSISQLFFWDCKDKHLFSICQIFFCPFELFFSPRRRFIPFLPKRVQMYALYFYSYKLFIFVLF